MNLYEIDAELKKLDSALEKWAEEHDGDITDFPMAEYENILVEEKEHKLLNIACWIKNLSAEYDAVSNEESRLKKRKMSIGKKMESLENLIKVYYPINSGKLSDARAIMRYQRSEKVIIDDESSLPDRFFKVEKKPMLSEIKSSINELEGIAHIQENWNLQIK